jgi:hypothetical protein
MIPLKSNHDNINKHYNDVKDIVLKRINTILRNENIKKGKKKNITIPLSDNLKLYLNSFKYGDYLEKLIKGDVDFLVSEIEYNKIHNTTFSIKKDDDYKILYNIFVDHGYGKISKYDFIKGFDINTCPYCNRNYIVSLSNKKIVKPEIDHFYPASIYPLFAISFHNLIPSCQSCNGYFGKHFKDSYDIKLRNPYKIKNNDFVFSFKVKNISIINPLSGKSSIDIIFKKKIDSNSEVFNLENYYKIHDDHILELIIKSRTKYSENYKNSILKLSKYKLSISEMNRMILGNYSLEKEQHKRPLSKLYQDIGRELGLIK